MKTEVMEGRQAIEFSEDSELTNKITVELSNDDAEAVAAIATELEISLEDFVRFSVRRFLQNDYEPYGREGMFRAIENVVVKGKITTYSYLDAV